MLERNIFKPSHNHILLNIELYYFHKPLKFSQASYYTLLHNRLLIHF
jgi:hypothetical protein